MNKILLCLPVVFLCACDSGVVVSEADFGEKWPLTVESGVVDCLPNNLAVFTHNDTTYGLTGLSQRAGYPAINPIWRDDPAFPDTKVSIGVLTKIALEEC